MTEDTDHTLDGVHPVLLEAATDAAVGDLAATVLRMRASGEARSAVNSTIMVEVAAELRKPEEIAELVAEFDGQSVAGDLARLALDAAAALRDQRTLARLARDLVEYGLAGRADELLALVVRRRLPRVIAELLTVLDFDGMSALTRTLVGEIARDDGRVFVLLWLRALNRADLAASAAQQMTALLSPVVLADFIRGLRAFQDTAAASAAFQAALTLDLATVAELTEYLRGGAVAEPDGDAYAVDFLNVALATLPLAELCVLAARLGGGGWPDGANLIWGTVIKGARRADLVPTLVESAQASGNPGAALDGIAKAAEILRIDDVAAIAVEVEGRISVVGDLRISGYDTVLDTVAQTRTMTDVFAMADAVADLNYGRVAEDLLHRVEAIVHQRKDAVDGSAIAEFIDRMLDRPARAEPHGFLRRAHGWEPALILRHVAEARDPVQLMGVIAGLTRRHKYDQCRKWIEERVPESYGGRLLAELPLVRRRDQLPAVLQILVRAFRSPAWATPRDIVAITRALREAGASDPDLRQLFAYTGGRRAIDYEDIRYALQHAGLVAEANWLSEGRRRNPGEPRFLG